MFTSLAVNLLPYCVGFFVSRINLNKVMFICRKLLQKEWSNQLVQKSHVIFCSQFGVCLWNLVAACSPETGIAVWYSSYCIWATVIDCSFLYCSVFCFPADSLCFSHMCLCEWLQLYRTHFLISTEVVYLQHCWLLCGWCHTKLLSPRCMFCVYRTTMHQFTDALIDHIHKCPQTYEHTYTHTCSSTPCLTPSQHKRTHTTCTPAHTYVRVHTCMHTCTHAHTHHIAPNHTTYTQCTLSSTHWHQTWVSILSCGALEIKHW